MGTTRTRVGRTRASRSGARELGLAVLALACGGLPGCTGDDAPTGSSDTGPGPAPISQEELDALYVDAYASRQFPVIDGIGPESEDCMRLGTAVPLESQCRLDIDLALVTGGGGGGVVPPEVSAEIDEIRTRCRDDIQPRLPERPSSLNCTVDPLGSTDPRLANAQVLICAAFCSPESAARALLVACTGCAGADGG